MGIKTLILGLGNPILSDDGVGIRVAQELKGRLNRPEITVEETSLAGLGVLDLLTGYDRVVLIDAIQTVGGQPGQIYRFGPEALSLTSHTASPHDTNFITALELGHKLGMALPRQIVIFAIEAADVTTFSEECTSEVRQAIPVCVEMILQELNGHLKS